MNGEAKLLTEPVKCKSCEAVSVNGGTIHCHACLKEAFREGFKYAIDQYSIWKNGQQRIGCMQEHIVDVLRKFDESEHLEYWAKNFRQLKLDVEKVDNISNQGVTDMNDRKTHTIDASKVKSGDIMALVYYVKVKNVRAGLNELIVSDLHNEGPEILVRGKELIEQSFSSDQYAETIKVSKTQAAEILIHSNNRPLTVTFIKSDNTERTLRGKLIKPEPLLGRSMVEDLELPVSEKNRTRLVDHRTIKELIVDGVKYIVN